MNDEENAALRRDINRLSSEIIALEQRSKDAMQKLRRQIDYLFAIVCMSAIAAALAHYFR